MGASSNGCRHGQEAVRCLHQERIAPDQLEPVHSRHIGGAYKVDKQHAGWTPCPVLVGLHLVSHSITSGVSIHAVVFLHHGVVTSGASIHSVILLHNGVVTADASTHSDILSQHGVVTTGASQATCSRNHWMQISTLQMSVYKGCASDEKERKVYAVRRHNGDLCARSSLGSPDECMPRLHIQYVYQGKHVEEKSAMPQNLTLSCLLEQQTLRPGTHLQGRIIQELDRHSKALWQHKGA